MSGDTKTTTVRARAKRASAATARSDGGQRISIIREVQKPLAFYVLAVLVVEGIIGVVASFSTSDRATIVLIMAFIIVLLILTVTALAWFRLEALQGQRVPIRVTGSNIEAPQPPIIKNPKILLAASQLFSTEEMGFQHDENAVKILENPPTKVEKDLSSKLLSDLMVHQKFEVIHLLTLVDQASGDLRFSDTDRMGADGFVELVRLNGTKLIILATCDSIALGGKLARVTNVIAASTVIKTDEFADWARNFFSILAQKNHLSTAFEISRSISNIPLLLLMKGDLSFDIS